MDHVTENYAPTLGPSRAAAIQRNDSRRSMCLRHDYRAASGYITAAEEFADSTEVMPVVLCGLVYKQSGYPVRTERRAKGSGKCGKSIGMY